MDEKPELPWRYPLKRRRFQFGLSALFVLVTACAILSSAYRWFFVAFALLAFGFWRAAYRDDKAWLGILVLIGVYVSFSCIAIAFAILLGCRPTH